MRKRQKTQGHNPVLMLLETHSQESKAPNPEAALRKFPQHLPSSRIFPDDCQLRAVPSPGIQHWGLEASESTVWGMGAFQTDRSRKGLAMRQELGRLATLNILSPYQLYKYFISQYFQPSQDHFLLNSFWIYQTHWLSRWEKYIYASYAAWNRCFCTNVTGTEEPKKIWKQSTSKLNNRITGAE